MVRSLLSGVHRQLGNWCSVATGLAGALGSLPGLKEIPQPRGLVSWLPSEQADQLTDRPVLGASMVGGSTPGSAASCVRITFDTVSASVYACSGYWIAGSNTGSPRPHQPGPWATPVLCESFRCWAGSPGVDCSCL